MVAVADSGGTTNRTPALLDVDPTWTKITSDPIVTDAGYFATGFWADYNNDGFLDLLLIRIDAPGPNPLYRNNGDGSFTRVMEPSLQGLVAVDGMYCWGDYDNDGWLDLFVPEGQGLGLKDLLYHNNGDGTFTGITDGPIVQEGGAASGGAWGDFNRDGWPDLCVANGAAGSSRFPPQFNSLYQGQGGGTFSKVTEGPFPTDSGYFDLPVWVDIDHNGWQDLFILNAGGYLGSSYGYNVLYRNTGTGSFVKVTDDPLVKEFDLHWGDGAWADYNNDGALDVFLTTARASIGVPGLGPVALFRNDGLGHFTKMTTNDIGPLAAEHADTYVCCWGDYDNDGWLDLYISNSSGSGAASRTDLLYHNEGDGTFTKVTRDSPVNELGASIAGWLVDLDNDGFLDLFTLRLPTTQDSARIRYYHNNGNSNAWLCVKCVGTSSPRFATGTKVCVKATIQGQPMWQLRVIDPGGVVNAQNFTAHFGLGDATNVDVLRIEWTSGVVQELTNVAVRQYLTVTEPNQALNAAAR